MWAFYAATFLVGLTSSQVPPIFDSKEYTRETSCMWPWAKQIGTPDNLKGRLLRNLISKGPIKNVRIRVHQGP